MVIQVLDKSRATKYFEDIVYLLRSIWPGKDASRTVEKDIETLRDNNEGKFERHILALHEEKIIGYSRIFARRIEIDGKLIDNMALASICVRHEYQGQGIGRKIVEKAFSFTDCGRFECSVFQTKVPDFYSKMGAIAISNKVVNSTGNQKAFWDPFIMLYPGYFDIGKGQIDIKGNGY